MMKMMDCRGSPWYDRSLEYKNRAEASIMYMIFMSLCNSYTDKVLPILNHCVRFLADLTCCLQDITNEL